VSSELRRALLLACSGLGLLVLAFPPISFWPAALLLPWPLTLLALEARSPARAAVRLYLTGLLFFPLGSLWLAETHWLNLLLVTLVEAVWLAVYGWAAARVLPRRALMPLLPLLWTGHEMARMCFPLSGYPWLFLGHAMAASPVAVQAADLGGVMLLSFIGSCGAAAVMAWRAGQGGWRWAVGVLVAAGGYGLVRPATLAEPTVGPRLVSIQPAFAQALKDSSTSKDERYRRSMSWSWQALQDTAPGDGAGPDLLVWPETMWPYPIGEGDPEDLWFTDFTAGDGMTIERRLLNPLQRGGEAGDLAVPLLLGTVYRWLDQDGVLRRANSAILIDETGRRLDRYDKHILVPGGESIPYKRELPDWLAGKAEGWIADIAGFVADLEPGPGPSLMSLGEHRFGVTICYENAYGDYDRQFARLGAAFLVNISNEAWFGTSTEFDHMELQSVLRAVETRRALFRATNSGISCLVRPYGRRPTGADRLSVDGADRAVAGYFAATIPLHTDRTLYTWWGDLWGWICLLGAAGCLLLGDRYRLP
jgi:apolipoprotein N-acyltransferase